MRNKNSVAVVFWNLDLCTGGYWFLLFLRRMEILGLLSLKSNAIRGLRGEKMGSVDKSEFCENTNICAFPRSLLRWIFESCFRYVDRAAKRYILGFLIRRKCLDARFSLESCLLVVSIALPTTVWHYYCYRRSFNHTHFLRLSPTESSLFCRYIYTMKIH